MVTITAFNSRYYCKAFLHTLFGLQLTWCLLNIVYITCYVPIWAIQDFYPLRVAVMSIVLATVLCYAGNTLFESVLLARSRFNPSTFLAIEFGKASLVLTWAWIAGLCLSATMEHKSGPDAYVACVVHSLVITMLISGLPYAAWMYCLEKRGRFAERRMTPGWSYENGEWVRNKDQEMSSTTGQKSE